jgi:hypothetical protein
MWEDGTDTEFTRAVEIFPGIPDALRHVVPVARGTRIVDMPDRCGDYGDEGECEGEDGNGVGEENSILVGC